MTEKPEKSEKSNWSFSQWSNPLSSLSKAPSETIVKGASAFGEEASKIIGKSISTSVETLSKDLGPVISDSSKNISEGVKDALYTFGEQLKQTGIFIHKNLFNEKEVLLLNYGDIV